MRGTLITTFTISLLALSGCGKQDYSDPQIFMEHYGHDLLVKSFGKEKMEEIGFDHFEFFDVKVGITQYQGEYVSASFDIIPKRGVRIHSLLIPKLMSVDCSLPNDYEHEYIADNIETDLREIGCKLNYGEFCPIVYYPKVLEAKRDGNYRLRMYRAKGSDGMLRPVSGKDGVVFYWDKEETDKACESIDNIFKNLSRKMANEDYLKKHFALSIEDTNAVHKTIAEYNVHVANITNAYATLRMAVNDKFTLKWCDFHNQDSKDYSPKLRELVDMRVAKDVLEKKKDEAKGKLQELYTARSTVSQCEKSISDTEASIQSCRPKLDKAIASRDKARHKVNNLAEQIAQSHRENRRAAHNLKRAQNELDNCEKLVVELSGKIAELERKLEDDRQKLAVLKANVDVVTKKDYIIDAQKTLNETGSKIADITSNIERLKIETEKECRGIVVRKAIDAIFTEVETMKKAIGNSK